MIILASKSKARKTLLKKLGIKFKSVAPRIKERDAKGVSPEELVKRNALLKARDVAGRFKKGTVIGCDTLVKQGNKIFGKPKNLKDAKTMLKKLSFRPHQLFTGIAVIDAESKKELLDVERTEIEMLPLTDPEIKSYFKKVNPLDKAGAFDIQGPGSFFIRRIKGCYFNIVGLPVSKMYKMLKKAGVTIFAFLCSLTIFGCATEFNVATGKKDFMMYSVDQEVNLGNSVSKQVEKEYILINDPEMNERVRSVGERIAAVCDRKAINYKFRIIEDKEDKDLVNAFALPGGYVYVFKNLLNEAKTDDELACVLAHEVAHIVARHGIKRLQAVLGYNLLVVLAAGTNSAEFARGAQAAYVQILMGYSREDELLADRMAAKYAGLAGYNPDAMITFLRKMRARDKKESARPLSYARTHPYIPQRIRATKEEIGEKISFDDFIGTL